VLTVNNITRKGVNFPPARVIAGNKPDRAHFEIDSMPARNLDL
jgi:hypothetical protein